MIAIMKRMLLCLLAMVGVLTLSAQSFMDNEVIRNIMARRSVRKYLNKPVEREKLEAIALAGINAPSAMNRQMWAVRIVGDTKLINEVSEVYKQANPDMVQRDPNFKNMFRNAPTVICVCAPQDGGFDLDAGLLGENMMLAAQSLGLGTCIQTGPVRFLLSNPKAKFFLDRLNIPDGYKLLYVIAVGYPDETPDAKPRDASKVQFVGLLETTDNEKDEGTADAKDDRIYDVVEENAQFPGGEAECYKWLSQNIKYPADCMENGIQGRVIVSFVVNKDGSIVDVKVVRSPDPSLSKEAIRVVSSMPKWKPAHQGNKVVRSRFNLPLMFRLNTPAPSAAEGSK